MDPHSFIARAEAQRWLGIAEKLLISHDLVGSKTFAIRARESDPRLEAADQILAIADTLLAAEKRVVGNNGAHQPDYYAILQLVRFVQDTDQIASQYRRLAVMLNPHQNQFPYSDQAFQLVNEAWGVLSNPMRKSMYDSDLDYSPQQQMNTLGFNLEQQHHHQQQPHNFFSINHMGAGPEQELPEQQQTFQSRLHQHQHQQVQQHNFLSQPNPVRPLPVREQEHMFQHREQDQLFQSQVQPFQVTSPPHQQNRPSPQPSQSQGHIQSPPATPQHPFSWPQTQQLSQPQHQKQQLQQQLQHQQLKQEQQQLQQEQLKQQKLQQEQLKQKQLQEEQRKQQQLHQEQLKQQMMEEQRKKQQMMEEQRQQQLMEEQRKHQQMMEEQRKHQQMMEEQRKQQKLMEEQRKQQQMMEEQRKQQKLMEEQRKQQQLIEEQRKQQQLIEEQRKQQQLIEEQRKQQQLIEEQRKQQQLIEEQRKQQQLIEEQRKQQLLMEEQRKQQLLEEQRKQQQLQEEQRRQQQFLEEQRRQQQLQEEEQRKRQQLLDEQRKQQQLQEEQLKQQQMQQEQLKQQQMQNEQQEQDYIKQNEATAQFPSGVTNNGVTEEEIETEPETEPMDDSPTFWTSCPYCFYMYEYPSVYVECTLRCDNCKRAFQAVRIASPPPIIEGQDACFYCWGFIPVGLSLSDLQKNNNKGTNSNWTPFSPLHTATNNIQNHLNEQAAPKENLFVNKSSGPRIYIDGITNDVLLGVSDPNSVSDAEWDGVTKKQKCKQKSRKMNTDFTSFKERIQVLALRAIDGGGQGSAKIVKHVGKNPRKQTGQVAQELGKLDLNMEFNNNDGEEAGPRVAVGARGYVQGEEDNIEGIGFFEGLDEYISSLPILSAVKEEKVKG